MWRTRQSRAHSPFRTHREQKSCIAFCCDAFPEQRHVISERMHDTDSFYVMGVTAECLVVADF